MNNSFLVLTAAGRFAVGDLYLIIAIFVLISFSAFFSMNEMAYSSCNQLRLRSLAEENKKGARKALYIYENHKKTIACILVGNNLVNIACTTIAAYLFTKYISNPTVANIINTVAITIIILIAGEILPKGVAKMNPEKTAMRHSAAMYIVLKVGVVFYYPFYLLQRRFTRHIKTEGTPTVTEDELESIIDTMEEEGVIDSDDADILQGAMNLGETSAFDIMTHRRDVVFISTEDSNEYIKKLFLEHQFSRMPVYKETRDNVIGLLNQKDFFTMLIEGKETSIKKIMAEPVFVSEETKVGDLIRVMQKTKKHLCIVLDQQGGTSGIVTLEDCLETMVGEIYDEHDDIDNKGNIEKLADGSYKIDADTGIVKLFETLEIENIPRSNYSTVGGFLYEQSEDLCKIGDIISFTTVDEQIDKQGNFIEKTVKLVFTVTKIEKRKIKETLLKIKTVEE